MTVRFRISGQTAMEQLQAKWRFDHDRSERILEIARRVGLNSEPVTGGLITITYHGKSHGKKGVSLYTIEDFSGKGVPHSVPVRYNSSKSSDSIPRRKKANTMPPRGRTATATKPAETEVEETAPVEQDLRDYLSKPFSPTMNDYLDWFAQEIGQAAEIAKEDPERLIIVGCQLYPKFQRSELNITRKAARKAEREAAVASNGDAEDGEAPAKRGRQAEAKADEPAPAPKRRGRPPKAAADAAY